MIAPSFRKQKNGAVVLMYTSFFIRIAGIGAHGRSGGGMVHAHLVIVIW